MLTVTKAVGILLMPPGIVVVLVLLGLLLFPRWRYLGGTLIWVGVLALLVLSLPTTGAALLRGLENSVPALSLADGRLRERAGAIVVLGGGRDVAAPEYQGDTVNAFTLERLRYAARLHRATNLPILVTGGSVFGEPVPEGELMQQALMQDFQLRATWVEGRSRTTYENALYTRAVLEAAGIRRVFLVTQAWHMPRAVWAFRRAGIEVIMAPTGFAGGHGSGTPLGWLPSSHGLSLSARGLRERLGLLWYRWRYASGTSEDRLPDPERVSDGGSAALQHLKRSHCRGRPGSRSPGEIQRRESRRIVAHEADRIPGLPAAASSSARHDAQAQKQREKKISVFQLLNPRLA